MELVGVAQAFDRCGQLGGIGLQCEIAYGGVQSTAVVVDDPAPERLPDMIEAVC